LKKTNNNNEQKCNEQKCNEQKKETDNIRHNKNLSEKSGNESGNLYNIEERKKGRIVTFQALFNYDLSGSTKEKILKFEWVDNTVSSEGLEYAKFLTNGTFINIEEIDKHISSRLKNWSFGRISPVDKSVLRFSIFSLLYEPELPSKVIINEAIEIVKQFGSDESYKFVNGILDAVKKIRESGN